MDKSLKESKKNRHIYALVAVYLILVIFLPYIKFGNRENFEITFIINLIFLLFIPGGFLKRRRRDNRTLITITGILFAILVMDSLSILNYIYISGSLESIGANIVPNAKVFLYIMLVGVFYNMDGNSSGSKVFAHIYIPLISFVTAVVGILQRLNFFNFNNWFTKYYISTESGKLIYLYQVSNEQQQYNRVLGTLSNPNFYSLELILLMVFIVSNVIFYEKKIWRNMNVAIALLLLVSIALTQSRTALITVLCIYIYIAVIGSMKYGSRSVKKYTVISVLSVVLFFTLIRFMNLSYLFDAIKNGVNTLSVTQRVDRWKDAIVLFKLHPVIGIGPVIGKYFPSVDNEYIHILRNYGILGLLAHLSFYFYLLLMTWKDIFSKEELVIRQYAFAVNLSIISVLITNVTMATFYHWRNFILILVISCMWAKVRHKDVPVGGILDKK